LSSALPMRAGLPLGSRAYTRGISSEAQPDSQVIPSRQGGAHAVGAAQRSAEWVENRRNSAWLPRLDRRELWSYRELVWVFAARDLKLRYRQTALGVAWALIQPLAGVAIFSTVFGHLTNVPHDRIAYPVFVYAGLVLWTFFATAVTGAAQILVEHRELVTRVYFPRILAPLAAVLPPMFDFALSLVFVAIFMAIFGVVPGLALILLPVWIVALLALAFGVGLSLSALNVRYRDVRHALPFVVQIWLFASPIIYPSSLFHGGWRYLYAVNPMVGIVDGFRWSLISAPTPPAADLISLFSGLVLLVIGFIYFGRVERGFADVV
jgi:lipopolysaccharide transport system permease protein